MLTDSKHTAAETTSLGRMHSFSARRYSALSCLSAGGGAKTRVSALGDYVRKDGKNGGEMKVAKNKKAGPSVT